MTTPKLVQFPDKDACDVPKMLRYLADQIERGDYDDAHNLGWVIDCGNGRVEVGLMGRAAFTGPELHLLFGIGMHRIQQGAIKP